MEPEVSIAWKLEFPYGRNFGFSLLELEFHTVETVVPISGNRYTPETPGYFFLSSVSKLAPSLR